MVLQPAPLCIKCKLPAKIACNACSDAPLYTSRASQGNLNAKGYYCSPECGLEDWDRHKKECGDLVKRKKLYKAGEVLQELFYVYREKMFNRSICRVECKDGNIFMFQSESPELKTFYDYLVPFRNDVMENKYQKWAVLAYCACCEAVGWFHGLIDYFLDPLSAYLQEVTLVPKQPTPVTLVTVLRSQALQDPIFEHEVIKITLHSGETYALDLSSAQYGYFEPIVPWDSYVASRVENWVIREELYDHFGGRRKHYETLGREGGFMKARVYLNVMVSDRLVLWVQAWENGGDEANRVTVQEIFGLEGDHFDGLKQYFLDLMQFGIDALLKILKQQCATFKADLRDENTESD